MQKFRRWLSLIAAFLVLLFSRGFASAQSTTFEYFPETGHNVQGEFLAFYNQAANPTLLYGYPITEQFERNGIRVQYFQRARFELVPGGQVQLAPLGRQTYTAGGQLVINNPLACTTYEQTGYAVCFVFRDFFNENGGVAQFGYPISPFEFHNNQIVQYFEKARFEWHPGLGIGNWVGLTDLGRIYFDQLGEDPSLLIAVEPLDARIKPVLSLQVRAFPLKAVALASDAQIIYVIVQDQNLQPVADAKGSALVRFPNGNLYTQTFTTSTNGIGIMSFRYDNQPNGQLVFVDLTISYNSLSVTTTTSFRIWY